MKSSTNAPVTTSSAATQPETAKASGTEPAGSASGATITGKVFFRGTAPSEKTIDMAADAACKASHDTPVTTRHYVVGANGELANVFVCVKEGLGSRTFAVPQRSVLDQKGCLYFPYVMGIQVNQELTILNSDPVLHNVHYFPNNNPEGNKGMPVQGMKFSVKFAKPELDAPVRFKCDVHPWMFAYVFVVSHPFFDVTRETGTFTLKGLPAGTYTIEAWHPKAGMLTNSVTVDDNETKEITFEYKGP
jgi:plastocyanin